MPPAGPRHAGVKGITVYRHGTRPNRVLALASLEPGGLPVVADVAYAGGCAARACEL